jgi:hypothetical protein
MEYVSRLYRCIQVFRRKNVERKVIKEDKTCSGKTCAVCIYQFEIVHAIYTDKTFVFGLVFS